MSEEELDESVHKHIRAHFTPKKASTGASMVRGR